MRIILPFLFICISQVLFSQITITELQKVLKMDQSKFESYCLLNKFKLNEYINNEFSSGTDFVKGFGTNTEYLTLYDKFNDTEKVLMYQTGNSTKYLELKSQIENAGYKLDDSYVLDNGRKYSNYSNNLFKITTVGGKSSSSPDEVVYNIFVKFNKN